MMGGCNYCIALNAFSSVYNICAVKIVVFWVPCNLLALSVTNVFHFTPLVSVKSNSSTLKFINIILLSTIR